MQRDLYTLDKPPKIQLLLFVTNLDKNILKYYKNVTKFEIQKNRKKTHSKLSYPKHYGKDFVSFFLSLSEYWTEIHSLSPVF